MKSIQSTNGLLFKQSSFQFRSILIDSPCGIVSVEVFQVRVGVHGPASVGEGPPVGVECVVPHITTDLGTGITY